MSRSPCHRPECVGALRDAPHSPPIRRLAQLVVSNIETDDGVLVIRDGQVVSPRLIHKLCNFALTSGIREPIYVIDLLASREMTTSFNNMARSESAYLSREN